MKRPKACIVQWNKKEMGRSYLLDAPSIVVGRSSSVDLVLHDSSVSRHHALISQHTDHYEVEDMVSSNGTFVNARKIEGRAMLQDGDILGFGSLLFKFHEGDLESLETAGLIQNKTASDPLTGLFNKAYLMDYLAVEATFFQTYDRPFTIIYLDYDNLAQLREKYGQEACDVVLAQGAQRIRNLISEFDVPARLGDDEFVIVMPNVHKAAALVLAEHLVSSFHEHDFQIGQDNESLKINQTVSIGVAQYANEFSDIRVFLDMARERMLQCKIAGGNKALS